MKYQVLFSLKNNEKVFKNVICCSRDRRFKGLKKKKKNILRSNLVSGKVFINI